jgi:phosphopantetheinyl transferase
MHSAEKLYILDNDLSEEERLVRFYEIWTRKEAFLKMLGIGIIINLSALNMAPGENSVWVNVPENVQSNSQEIYIYTISANTFVLSVCANFPYLACFEEIKPQ